MKKLGAIAALLGAGLAGWCGAMAAGCSTASAAPSEEPSAPEVIEVKCAMITREGLNVMAIEKAFPDRKIADLARTVAVVRSSDVSLGYTSTTAPVMVKDGSVFVRCQSGENVTLVVPPAL
jgi:hypothetical protein